MSKKAKILLAGAISFVAAVYLFLGFGLPPILRSVAVSKLSEALERKVSIEKVTFNPFKLIAEVKGIEIRERDGSAAFFSLAGVRVNLEASSLFKLAPVVSEVALDAPRLSITRNADNSYNFSDLLEKKPGEEEKAPDPKEEKAEFKFLVENIRLSGGAIDFNDIPVASRHNVADINLFIPVISNLPVYVETFSKPGLSFVFDGSKVSLDGETKPFADSLETRFALALGGLDLTRFLPYSPVGLNFDLKSARLDLDLALNYIQRQNGKPSIGLTGTSVLGNVELLHKDKSPLFSLSRLEVKLKSSDLIEKKAVVESILIDSPSLAISRDKKGSLSVENLVASGGEEKKDSGESAPLPGVLIEKTTLKAGRVAFADNLPKKPFKTILFPVEAEAADFNLATMELRTASLSIAAESGEKLTAEAGGILKPLKIDGKASAEGFSIPRYASYYGDFINFEIQKGVLGAGASFHVEEGGKIQISNAGASLADLRLKKTADKEPFAELKSLTVAETSADLETRRAEVGKIAVLGVAVRGSREADKSFSWDNLIPAPKEPAEKAEEGGEPWIYLIKDFSLAKSAVYFEDRGVTIPASFTLSPVSGSAGGISNEAGREGRFALSLTTGREGKVALGGRLSINPLKISTDVSIEKMDLTPASPYLTENMKLLLAQASLSLKGSAVFDKGAEKPKASFNGDVSLEKFKLLEEATAEELLRWAALDVSAIGFNLDPLEVSIGGIALTDPYLRIDVAPDGVVNLADLSKTVETEQKPGEPAAAETPAAEPAATEAAPQAKIIVEGVAIRGGEADFSDRHIQPSYRAKLAGMTGKVAKMSSMEMKGGEVNLIGSLNNSAPFEMTGTINPLAEQMLIDLKFDFRNMDLSPLTPYSSRYLGYKIDKGKLALALQYKILGKKLDSENKLICDQLTLGDEVESPDAIGIPVSFALALLTDRNGVIDLDVPVSGTLDDPEFSLGRIIWKVIVNILVKAATSPFKLIASLFGGGEDISYAVFEPAAAALPAQELSRVDKLVKAMQERPGLKLEVRGYVDPEEDRLALRAARFENKLKAQKVRDMVAQGKPALPVDEVSYLPEERQLLVAGAFDLEKIPRPAPAGRPTTPEEMEQLLLTHITVTDDDLRTLAGQRADTVVKYLTAEGRVEPARVFLAEAKALTPEPREGVPNRCVDFVLK